EPFSDGQVERRLEVWNGYNASPSFRPLPAATVLRHRELASQPLLLLLLAVYDADGNPLQQDDAGLRRAELYERLLTRFAEREVLKTGAALPDDQVARAVERELLRLSMVAFAMFNRWRQWGAEAELDADLAVLFGDHPAALPRAGFRADLTAAQVVVGRFFFIHEARAVRDETRLRPYEFLHATFGEYLIARALSRELRDLAEDVERAGDRSRPAHTNDDFLHALLSFAPLSRGAALQFFEELVAAPGWRLGQTARTLLIDLFRGPLGPRRASRYAAYQPATLQVPARYALYSANLLLLAVPLSDDGGVTASELFPQSADLKGAWHRMALLWRSQIPPEGFTALLGPNHARPGWTDAAPQPRIATGPPAAGASTDAERTDDDQSGRGDGGSGDGRGWRGWRLRHGAALRRQERFLCGHDEDVLLHAVEPLVSSIPESLVGFGG